MKTLRLANWIVWPLAAILFLARMLEPALTAQAALYWASANGENIYLGVRSKNISVCFVGDAVTARPDRVRQIVAYMKNFEYAANIRFQTLWGDPLDHAATYHLDKLTCPDPGQQSNDYDYYYGDIRMVIPETNVDAETPVPGYGCETDKMSSAPDAVSWDYNRIDVFWRGWDDSLRHKLWNATDWSDTENLGGVITSGPTASSWGTGRLDVFARGLDGALWWKSYAYGWGDWSSLGGSLAAGSDPDAVSWGTNRIDVFARWTDDHLYHISTANGGSTWSAWEDLGGAITSGPGVSSWAANRLDVFVRGSDGGVWHRAWNSSYWTDWDTIGGNILHDPDAVSWGINRIDVFAVGVSGHILTNAYTGSGWTGWVDLGITSTTSPGVASWAVNRLDLFGSGYNEALYHTAWNPSSWSAWSNLGDNSGWGSWSTPPWVLNNTNNRACEYNLKLGDDPWDSTPYLNHTLHEVGHALGLAHEHARSDADPTCTASGFGGGITNGFMTPYDRDSVMNYYFPTCNIFGNYSFSGLSNWDKLALHILYPEDSLAAEYVGTTVIPQGGTLNLQSGWQSRGANMSFVANTHEWKLNGVTYSTTPQLYMTMSTPGNYTLEYSFFDFLGRRYYSTGKVHVLSTTDYLEQEGATSAAASVLVFTPQFTYLPSLAR